MRRYLIFAVAGISVLLFSIDANAVSVAFPVIINSFDVSIILAGWILSGYQLMVVAAIPLAGKISDALGRKPTFIAFLSLFTLGSALCSMAPNVPLLIVFRVIEGLGGSGFVPSANGIVADQFPKSRQQAIGLISSILPIGWVLGPNIGAWITTVFGWRYIFLINIPLCVIALVLAGIFMPGGQRKESHIDLVGSGLLACALVTLMSGISQMGRTAGRMSWALVVILLGSGIVSLVLFWRRQIIVPYPVIEPEVFRGKPFVAANIYNLIYGGIIGAASLIPLYAVSVYNMTTIESGLVVTPRSIGMLFASALTSFFLVRWGYRRPMLVGTITMIPAFILFALEPDTLSAFGFSSMVFVLIVAGLLGLSHGILSPASNNACIELMPDRVATITAMRTMFRQGGQAFMITIASLILHEFGMARGFQVFFFAMTALTVLVMVPAIFAMPRSPTESKRASAR